MTTAEIAVVIFGDKLYQKRARGVLPILVRQAKSAKKIYYSDLAEEVEMPNARNLNYVLGALSEEWGAEIPALQSLVVNRQQGLPGE